MYVLEASKSRKPEGAAFCALGDGMALFFCRRRWWEFDGFSNWLLLIVFLTHLEFDVFKMVCIMYILETRVEVSL